MAAATTDVSGTKWIDIFLVEPSLSVRTPDPTDKSDIYVEIIGETNAGAGSSDGAGRRRDMPYLIK